MENVKCRGELFNDLVLLPIIFLIMDELPIIYFFTFHFIYFFTFFKVLALA